MSSIPPAFAHLLSPDAPQIVKEAVKLYGTVETPGPANNKIILNWAKELGDQDGSAYAKWAAKFYNLDSIPWCGLFMAIIAHRSNPDKLNNRKPVEKYLSALEWNKFGSPVIADEMIVGDIAVMNRDGGGHVTLVVGISPDKNTFYGLGGNQGDKVSIAPFPTARVRRVNCSVRRIPYEVKPIGAKQILVKTSDLSTVTEA